MRIYRLMITFIRLGGIPITKGHIALILLSGKESNLTQPMVSYTGTTFLSTLEE